MRKATLLLSLALGALPGCFLFEWIGGTTSGWERYVDALQKQARGLSPYWIPNSDDGPGTILEIVDGAEQLFLGSKPAFPNLRPDTSSIPTAFATEISSIKFEVGSKPDDQQVLPFEVEAVANLAFTERTEMSLAISQPRIVRIGNALLTEQLRAFDVSNPRQDEILKRLLKPDARLISGAILAEGFVFTFNNVSSLDLDLEAHVAKGASNAKLRYEKISDHKFSIRADRPMYLAYYAYPINREELKRLYEDLHRMKHLKAEIVTMDSLAASISRGVSAKDSLARVKADLEYLRMKRDSLMSKAFQLFKPKSDFMPASARKESIRSFQVLRMQIVGKDSAIVQLFDMKSKFESKVVPVEMYQAAYQLLMNRAVPPREQLEDLRRRTYDIFGAAVLMPAHESHKHTKK